METSWESTQLYHKIYKNCEIVRKFNHLFSEVWVFPLSVAVWFSHKKLARRWRSRYSFHWFRKLWPYDEPYALVCLSTNCCPQNERYTGHVICRFVFLKLWDHSSPIRKENYQYLAHDNLTTNSETTNFVHAFSTSCNFTFLG